MGMLELVTIMWMLEMVMIIAMLLERWLPPTCFRALPTAAACSCYYCLGGSNGNSETS